MNVLLSEDFLSHVVGGFLLYDVFKIRIVKTGVWKKIVGEVDDPTRAINLINFNIFYSCLYYLISNTVGTFDRRTIREIASQVIGIDFDQNNQPRIEKLIDKFLLNPGFEVDFRTYANVIKQVDHEYIRFINEQESIRSVQELLLHRHFIGFSIIYLGDKSEYVKEFSDRVDIMSLFVELDFMEEKLRKCYKDVIKNNNIVNTNENIIQTIDQMTVTASKIEELMQKINQQDINKQLEQAFEQHKLQARKNT